MTLSYYCGMLCSVIKIDPSMTFWIADLKKKIYIFALQICWVLFYVYCSFLIMHNMLALGK